MVERLQAAAIEVAADQLLDAGGGIAEQRTIGRDQAREVVVDDDRGNGGDEADGGRQQRLGDAGRDHREVGGLRLRDADEAVHDAPHGAEQPDERRGRADGGEQAGAAPRLARGRVQDALEHGFDALLDARRVEAGRTR